MMKHTSSHRPHAPEARLLRRAPSTSPETMKAAELLQNPATELDALQDAIQRGLAAQEASGEFMDTLTDTLQEQDRAAISRNLDELAKRATDSNLGALKSTIDQIRGRMDAAPASALQPDNEMEKETPEKKTVLSTIGEGIGNTAETISNTVLPKSWNEHMSRNQKIAAGTAITLGAGVVLWQLGKMLFGRGKKAVEEGKEAASHTKGGFFRKLLIGGLVLGGVFFGARALFKSKGSKDEPDGGAKKGNPFMDYLWKHLVPDEAKPYLQAGQDALATGVKTVETVTPVASGAGTHLLKRGKEAVNENAQVILDGMRELDQSQSAEETAGILALKGLSLLYVNGKWVIDNGIQTFTVPFTSYKRLFLDKDIDTYQEKAWLYGEAGAAYVLGRTTINSILTGKLPMPASFTKLGLLRSAAGTLTQSALHPFLFLYDGAHVAQVFLSGDGRTILNGQLLRSGYVGAGRELLLKFKTIDDFVKSAQYFQDQQAFLTALEKSKHVDPRVVNDIRTSVLNIADKIAKNAQKVNIADAPEWLVKLKTTIVNQKSGEDLRRTVSEITATIPKVSTTVVETAQTTTRTTDAVVDTVTAAAKAADNVDEVAENTRLFDRLVEAISAARKLGQNEQILKLLESPLVQTMAKQGNKMAQALQNVWRLVAPGARYASRVLVVLGPLIDAALITANRYEIAAAQKTGNKELVKTLQEKERALVDLGGISIVMIAAPATAIALPLVIPTAMYVNAVYDSMATWQKSPEDWSRYSVEDLRAKLEEYKMGKIDRGHRAAYGYSAAYAMWRWGTSWSKESKEKNAQEDEKQGEDVEKINQNVRQELLLAYFMKTQLQPHRGETPEQYKERVKPMLQDCMSYIKRFTSGTFDASLLGERFFEQAKDYADLNAIRRSQPAEEIRYQTESGEKNLDLTALNYIGQGGDEAAQMKFLKTMHQYETEVKIQKEAVEDLYRMDTPLA